MISYKLAKELKDAGYYQKSAGDRINPKGDLEYSGCWDDENEDDYVTLPTLSELIEACKLTDFCLVNRQGGDWIAGIWETFDQEMSVREYGSTPEEAIARLWLALNKK